ncbi:Asp23/Gls24 family envelope stress response protein [Bacillus ndiopicus]|uniref:hypothetical protein n=1 Tax=Bacillus ndiopicus TaxID=1347368 RepID=UPI0005A9D37D|nr:hypothetical protein [Bacillus ndiopicus]
MDNSVSYRYLFLIIGVSLLIFSPLIIFFIPSAIPMTFYFERYTWFYYTPMEAYIVFGIGVALLIACCALLFFGKKKKISIISSSLLLLVAIALFYGSSKCYIAMDDNGLTYRGLFESNKQHVGWENVKEIELIEVPEEEPGNSTFIIGLDNGDVLTFKENVHVRESRGGMRAKYQEYNIPVTYTDSTAK